MFLFSLFIAHCYHDYFQSNVNIQGTNVFENSEIQTKREEIRIIFDETPFNNSFDAEMCQNEGDSVNNFYSNDPITCKKEDILTNDGKKQLNNALKSVQTYVSGLLKVNRLVNPINPSKLGNFLGFPLKNESFSADLFVIVTVRPFASNYLSDSGSVYHPLSFVSGRPTVASIFLNPSFVNKATEEKLFAEILHQVFHVLGLSESLVSHWIDPETKKEYKESPISIFHKKGAKDFRVLHSKHSKDFVEKRFATNNLFGSTSGIELHENGFHTSSRVYYTDIMNSDDFGARIISGATLAMLSDTSFYDVNLEKAEILEWGMNLKPSFATEAPQKVFPYNYLCNDDKVDDVCSYDYKSRAKCVPRVQASQCETEEEKATEYCKNIDFYNPKHNKFVSDVADYQIVKEYHPYACSSPLAATNMSKGRSESFKNNSYCAMGTDKDGEVFSGCYPITCSSTGSMFIQIGEVSYSCDDNKQIKLPGDAGTIICPPKETICPYVKPNDHHVRALIAIETAVLFLIILFTLLIIFCAYCCIVKERKNNNNAEATTDLPLIV